MNKGKIVGYYVEYFDDATGGWVEEDLVKNRESARKIKRLLKTECDYKTRIIQVVERVIR